MTESPSYIWDFTISRHTIDGEIRDSDVLKEDLIKIAKNGHSSLRKAKRLDMNIFRVVFP